MLDPHVQLVRLLCKLHLQCGPIFFSSADAATKLRGSHFCAVVVGIVAGIVCYLVNTALYTLVSD